MSDFAAGLLFGVAMIGILAGGVVFFLYWNKNKDKVDTSTKVRLLSQQYRAMTDSAAREIPMELLGRPEFISSRMEFRKIEAIEAELTGDADRGIAQKLLVDFFQVDDPWVKARAAKALYPLDAKTAVVELRAMAKSSSPFVQLPGIWALGELSSDRALEILMSMVWHKNPEVQKAVIRSLVLKETKHQIPPEYVRKVKDLLNEVRYKTDWIL
jgi:HEAT repeat protein